MILLNHLQVNHESLTGHSRIRVGIWLPVSQIARESLEDHIMFNFVTRK